MACKETILQEVVSWAIPRHCRFQTAIDAWSIWGVLLLSDSLLFLPAIAAAITFPALRLTPSELVIHYLVTGALISLVLAAQLSELHQKFSSRLLIILTTNILLSLSLESSEYLVAWLLQSVALTIALALVFMPESQRPCAPRQWQHLSLTRTWQPLGILFHPALAIQFKALFKERAAETFMRLGASFAMALGADALSNIEEYDYRSLPTGIIALAAIAIMVSGFYRMLHSLHSPVSEYMHTLPVPDGFWALRDASLIIALGFAPFCMIMYPLLIQHIVSPLTAGLTGIAYLSLMVLLRFSQLHGGRQSVLLSTIIAAAWAWFTAISVI